MIIVSGRIYVQPGTSQAFVAASTAAMTQARNTLGCRDFVVAVDPLEPDRINVYEEWESEEALLGFRGAGPDDQITKNIVRAEVASHVVASSGPA